MSQQGDFFNNTVLGMNPLSLDPSSGKPMPHNDEILASINKLRKTIAEQQAKGDLDQKGRNIAQAFDQLLTTTQTFVQEKNSDEAFQHFIEDCVAFAAKAKEEAKSSELNTPGNKDHAKDQLSNISVHLKSIVQQFFTSTDTRNMMRELEKFIENCYDMTKKMRQEGNFAHETAKETRRDMVRSMMTLLAKIGRTPSWKKLREELEAMYDYFISDKQHVNPRLQSEFSKLVERAIDLLNRFTGERDLFILKGKLESTYNEVRKDPEATQYFTKWRKWADDIVAHPDSIEKESTIEEGDQIVEQGLRIFDRHSSEITGLSEEFRLALHSMRNDRFLNAYKDHVADVGRSMKGSYLNSIVQLKTLVAPIVASNLKEAKLPKIENRDKNSYWSLDNISIHGKESHLDDISLDIRIGLKDLIQVVATVRDIDITLKDIDFVYERTSMPSFSDKGRADVRITAPRWRMKWIVNQDVKGKPYFELSETNGRISRLDISIKEANHSMLDSIVTKMWAPVLRRRVQSSIEDMLNEKSQPISDKLNQFFAKESDSSSSHTTISHTTSHSTEPSVKVHTTTTTEGETKPVVEKKVL